MNTLRPRNLSIRVSSYPYLGSDTFYTYCDIHILTEYDLNNFISNRNQSLNKMYIHGSLVNKLIENIINIDFVTLKYLIIMESDEIQQVSDLKPLLKVSNKIFSNNLIGKHDLIKPLPLGLERQGYRSAGRLKNFKKPPIIDFKTRSISFLVAWNDLTNTNRLKAREIFSKDKRSLIVNKRLNARTVHKLMRKSLFVPSPAGNGPDCHRTWEAIYLGCVPVVLKSEFTGLESWPVLLIDDWSDLINKSSLELENLYKFISCDRNKAFNFSKKILSEISG